MPSGQVTGGGGSAGCADVLAPTAPGARWCPLRTPTATTDKTTPARSPTPAAMAYGDGAFHRGTSRASDVDRVNDHVIKRLIEEDDFPAFSYVLLPRDHTFGVRPGSLTPAALIAENDYATGLLVAAISRSKSATSL